MGVSAVTSMLLTEADCREANTVQGQFLSVGSAATAAVWKLRQHTPWRRPESGRLFDRPMVAPGDDAM